ncbi:docking protein 2 [Dunckerocampus dactyliophorus]|uniref:docking protein 2 n=1 Tax=Dunckerocampus dactyliophorus TaxID=161453 RepID=UPI002404E0D4|nr:docking protein 2 [Dunckerocampus dactyliophorus]XP_054629753.1 docking protein 2 [Dunckerocampus dactyliophorus]
MDDYIRKEGQLYLQQQHTFGKKWKSMWCVLFGESWCSISRLELYESKDGGGVEKKQRSGRKQHELKKVIRLSDCIRVSETDVNACPRDTASFLVETTDKTYVFAARRQHVDDWTLQLCQTAFPGSWAEPSRRRGSLKKRSEEEEGMEDNMLYSSRTDTLRDFRVCVRRTDAAERCSLKGDGVLRASLEALHLLDSRGVAVLTWPYRFLRRFGRDKNTFSFEAGRRCESGEGSFEFDTKEGNFLFQAVEAAISLQRVRHASGGGPMNLEPSQTPGPPPGSRDDPQSLGTQVNVGLDQTMMGVHKLTLDADGSLIPKKRVHVTPGYPVALAMNPGPRPSEPSSVGQTYSQVSFPTKWDKTSAARACAPHLKQDGEYSLPFHGVSKKATADTLISQKADGTERFYEHVGQSPMESKDMTTVYRNEDHIYDEPESCVAPPSEYDDPEEMKGDAWRVMAAAGDQEGHDYAVPKPSKRSLPVARQEIEVDDRKM